MEDGAKNGNRGQMIRRNVVLVSPYFPPSTLAGVHRARHLAKHLPAAGWNPIVLCADEVDHVEALDPALFSLVPEQLEIVKVRATQSGLARMIGLGDIGIRAWFQLRQELIRLIKTRCIDAVMITGSPYYPMLLASLIKRKFGIPVVLDFQDPWVSAWGAMQSTLSKGGVVHRLACALEPYALRHADFITSVSETQNSQMSARYPWLNSHRMAAIPIGGDPEDFARLNDTVPSGGETDLDPGFINLSYVGTILPRAFPLVRTLFRAFARLRTAEPALAARIRLNFIGTSNQPNDTTTLRALPLAELEGVAEAIREIPQRIPYLRALSVLTRSQGLLLIGSDEPHYTASKIYPGLMSGRPFLSLFHGASSAHEILTAAGGGCAFAFTSAQELAALEIPLANALRRIAFAPETLGRANPAMYASYEARVIARHFANIFDSFMPRRQFV